MSLKFWVDSPNKTLHPNRRPALGFGLSCGLFEAGRPHHVIVRSAVGELVRRHQVFHAHID